MSEGTPNMSLPPEKLAELVRQQAAEQAREAGVEAPPTPQATVTPPPVVEAPSRPAVAAMQSPPQVKVITLTDGRTVTLQKPVKPTTLHLMKVLGADSTNSGLLFYFNALMWVREVSSLPQPVPFLAKREQFEGLHELLGDEALEEIAAAVHSIPMPDFDKDAVGKS